MNSILILGRPDPHTARIQQEIESRGGRAVYFETRRFPGAITVAFDENTPCQGYFRLEDGEKLPFQHIRAVYWYCFEGVAEQSGLSPYELDIFLWTLLRNLDPGRWVNPPQAVRLHQMKVSQLKAMKALGLPVPETLMTNDPEALQAFFARHEGRILCKPFTGFGLARVLQPGDLAPEVLRRLVSSPTLFQAFVPGRDIRVHIVGEQAFPSVIETDTEHYKTDPQMRIRPVDLPDALLETCRAAARSLGLPLAGIDLRQTPVGAPVFLEINPSPQFMRFEEATGHPISACLADLLLS